MDKKSFLSTHRRAKWGPGREVGVPRRRRNSFWRDWFVWLEARQLLSGMVTETVSYSASVPVQLTDFSKSLALQQFNPALGTLDSVALSLAAGGNVNGTVTNPGPTTQTFTISDTVDLTLLDGSTSLLASTLPTSQTFPDLPVGGNGMFGPFMPTQNTSANYTSGATFNSFIGTGDIGLTLQTNTSVTFSSSGGGSPSYDLNTMAGGTATVTYTYSVATVSVSGNVYDDVKGTGSLQPGDLPIPGTSLMLLGSTGTVVATTQTAANGSYSFTTTSAGAPLLAGTYDVVETQPAGYLQGTNTVGTVNGVTVGMLTSIPDVIASIALAPGQDSINNNFGEVLPVGLSGSVYVDANHTGSLMAGDPPIVGVRVNLFDPSGLVATTATDAFGSFVFTASASGAPLRPDTYTLVELQPAGYLQGMNTVGTVNGVPVGNEPSTDVIGSIVLQSGQVSIHNNFGELTPPTPPPPPPPPPPPSPPPPPPPPPAINFNVTNVQRYGVHLQPTLVVISFDMPLNPATAQDVGAYQLSGPTDSKHSAVIPIQSASYNPAIGMVTLRLRERLDVHHPYRLTINGLQDVSGGLLIGSNGVPGGSYVATVNRSNLAGFTDIYGNFVPVNYGQLYPAAIASGYHLKRFVPPAQPGPFAAANTATFLAATADNPEPAPITLHKGKKLTTPKPARR